MNTISQKGVLEIAEHEGVVLGPYLDSKNIWTYGVGHTSGAGAPYPERMERVDTRDWSSQKVKQELIKALKLFDEDLDKYEARVNQAVRVPLEQHEYDALVSFDFNTGGINRALLTSYLNSGNKEKAANGFMGWLRPKEIIKRRKAEMNLFVTGNYEANGSLITVWDALSDGRLKWRGNLNSKELRDLMKTSGAKREPSVLSIDRVWSFLRGVFRKRLF